RAAPLVARFDKKVARGLDGRRGLSARLAAWGATQRHPERPLVWMHAPSVGEGLQAKPVLETLRAEHPDWQLAFTFFSPSAERLDKTREPLARLAQTTPDTFTIVAGSTWPSDEAVLLPAFADLLHQLPTARLLLAPHEPNPDHLAGIADRLKHLKLPRPVRL